MIIFLSVKSSRLMMMSSAMIETIWFMGQIPHEVKLINW